MLAHFDRVCQSAANKNAGIDEAAIARWRICGCIWHADRALIKAIWMGARRCPQSLLRASTGEIARRLSVSDSEVTIELTPMDGKVVKLDKEKVTWRVLF